MVSGFRNSCRFQESGAIGQLSSNKDRLPSLQRICQQTFETVVYSTISKSTSSEDNSVEEVVHPNNNNAILSLLNTSEVTCITGNAELNINRAERKYHLEATLIDNEDMRRKMSTLSTRIELQFDGIRKKLNTKSDKVSCTEHSEEAFASREENDDILPHSTSEETRATHQRPVEIISAGSYATRLVPIHSKFIA